MLRQIDVDLFTGATVTAGRRVMFPIFVPVAITSPRFKISTGETSPNNGAMSTRELLSGEILHVSTTKTLTVAGDLTQTVANSNICAISEINGTTQVVTLVSTPSMPVGCLHLGLEKNPLELEKIVLSLVKNSEKYAYGHFLFVKYNESGVCINKQLIGTTVEVDPYNRIQTSLVLDIQTTIDNKTEIYYIAPSDITIPVNTKMFTASFIVK